MHLLARVIGSGILVIQQLIYIISILYYVTGDTRALRERDTVVATSYRS